jgi:uncharacterized protein YfaS (alpha-2-macroglobulin family)
MKIKLLGLLSALCLVLGSCGDDAPEQPLHVVGHGPTGTVEDAKASLRISFDRPVVDEKQLGQGLADVPLEVTPKLPLAAHWVDRQTLVATPQAPLRRATRYTVALRGALAKQLGQSFSFSFVHDPLDVLGPSGVDPHWVPPELGFALRFDQEVEAGDVVEHCQLISDKGGAKLPLTTPDDDKVAREIVLGAAKLKQGQNYVLRCEGLKPKHGDATLQKPYEQALHVYPKLTLTKSTPADGAQVTPDDLTLALGFSTPVEAAELQKHVRLTPAHKALRREWLQRNDTLRELTASLEAATTYTLEVDGKLRDRFGQKLGKTQKLTFTTTDASPALSMENGIYAVEAAQVAQAKGYPLWSRNVDAFSLECAYVPKGRIVALLNADVSYQSWYDASHPDVLDFRALGLKPKRQQIAPPNRKNKWTRNDLNLAERCGTPGQRGLFLAEVRSPAVEARRKESGGVYPYRLLGNVTDLGVMLKVGPSSGLVWVASLQTAQPLPGASVTLYDPSGHRAFAGTTDERGLLLLPGSEKLLARDKPAADHDPYEEEGEDSYRNQRLIAVVEKDGDLAVVDGNWSDGLEAWNFNLNVDRSGGELAVRGFLETDRGIYRPGETVHVKGLAREVPLSGEPRLPSEKQVQVRVEDGGGATLHDQKLTLTEFGGFSFDVALGPEARTGDYYVSARLGKQTFRQNFSVEEVRPLGFEVTAPKAPESLKAGASAKLTIEARYLFGAPVADAHVRYEIERRRHWLTFPDFEDYSFEDFSDSEWDPWWSPDHYADFVSEGEGTTDEKGRYQFTLVDARGGSREPGDTETKDLSGPQDYLVRASVRDATDQEVTKRLSVTAHPSEFYLGVAADSWVAVADKPFSVRVVAVDTAGKRVGADAKLSVERVETRCGRAEEPYASWTCDRKRVPVTTRSLRVGDGPPAREQLSIATPGEHLVRVETRDAGGNAIASTISVWVIGSGQSYWASDDSARMDLIPGKRRYAPGETAVLVPEAATEGGTLLVTVERNGVLEARLERPQGTAGIAIPITQAHAPNVFVSVALIRGRRGERDSERPELKLGMANLPVSFGERALKVEISTEGADFQPRQRVNGKVRVLAQDGSPVRAEVALSAADEGILQLIAYRTPNPLDSIYAPWGLGVQNATSWNRVAKLGSMAEEAGEEGADGAGAARAEVRSRFVASAFWDPALVTDEKGEASFSFEAPDNLTAFRLMAAAADAGTRFGAGEQRIRVRKDLLIAPVVPRFLLNDDEIELGAVIHNYTDHDGEVEASFELEGGVPRRKSARAKIAAGGKAVVRFPVKVHAAERAVFHASASMQLGQKELRDALELTLPVERAAVKDTETLVAGRGPSAKATLAWQSGIDEKASALELLVDRTGLADLGPSLRYLVHYPYGCLEQTMSGFVPLLTVRELGKSLGLPELAGEKLDTYIKLGVAKVIRHQHADGHFSLWPDSKPYPHLTVYALWGLNEAKRSGAQVERRALDLGLAAVRGWANDPARNFGPGDETGTLAMAAFVMSDLGAPDAALNARLFEARKALPVYGKAFLARALARAKTSPADVQALLSELSAAVRMEGDSAVIDDPIAPQSWYFSSASRSMALVSIALLEQAPKSSLIEPLVLGLKKRRHGGRWANTQENVYGLLAIGAYARAQGAGKAKLTVRAGERSLAEETLNGGAISRVRVPLADLTRGALLTLEASEPVFYSALLHAVRPEPVAAALDHGFKVRRDYLDMQTGAPVSKIRVGDLVKVRVQVTTPQGRSYVAITDPLPSGFESVNSALASERDVARRETAGWYWDYRALRDERTDWFADSLEAGTRELEYVLRATHAGTFTVPPTRAHEMYQESVMGHAASNRLTVVR